MNICPEYVSESREDLEIVSKSGTNFLDTESTGPSDKWHLETGKLYYVYRFLLYCDHFNVKRDVFHCRSFEDII